MNYGLWLSATGVVANSYRQDVIANNLANSETTGFKRDLALFTERRTQAQEQGLGAGASNPLLENLGGGMLGLPTMVDSTQGDMQPTGRNLDCAIDGRGFFMVEDQGARRLTRNGNFLTDAQGFMVLGNEAGHRVLDIKGQPIQLDPRRSTTIAKDGTITQDGKPVAQLGVFDVPDPTQLSKRGATLLDYPNMNQAAPVPGLVRSQVLEESNVDSAKELSELMNCQRELEANANMIRYQDQTLQRLVNDVAKVS